MGSFSIDQLVADLVDARRRSASHAGAAVREVVGRTVAEPSAIEAALGDAADLPTFSTWHNDDELTVLHVIWPPGVDLFAHDHRMWAAIGLYGGREDNALFRTLPAGELELRDTKTLRSGDTVLLGDDTVHAVANPSREWTGAMSVATDGTSAEAIGAAKPSAAPRTTGATGNMAARRRAKVRAIRDTPFLAGGLLNDTI